MQKQLHRRVMNPFMTFYMVVDAIGTFNANGQCEDIKKHTFYVNDQCEDIKKDIFYVYMYLDSSVLFIYLMNAFL